MDIESTRAHPTISRNLFWLPVSSISQSARQHGDGHIPVGTPMRLLLLLALPVLAAGLTAGKELKTTGHGKSQVLHLAAFLPYTYSNTYGNGLELALVMALEAINADPAVLANVELRIHTSNTACSKDVAGLALLKQM